jgi:hypothetical protein
MWGLPMTDPAQPLPYHQLPPAQKAAVRVLLDTTIECLNEFTRMIEHGDLPPYDGPASLRYVAIMLNQSLIEQEDENGE